MVFPVILSIARSEPLTKSEVTDLNVMTDGERLTSILSREPAALGVHPGDAVCIYTFEVRVIAPSYRVESVGCSPTEVLTITTQKVICSTGLGAYSEIQVRVPAPEQLQTCESYSSNPVMLWLQLRITNTSSLLGGEHSPDSIPIVVWKPWPLIVAISRSRLALNRRFLREFGAMSHLERVAYLIRRDPAALGVHPGDPIFIDVLDLNAGTRGRRYGVRPVHLGPRCKLTVARQQTILADGFYRYQEIEVKVPTLDQLQGAESYEANALMMGLQFQVDSPSGGTSWSSLPIMVWMPWPAVSTWVHDTSNPAFTTVRVGARPDPGTGQGSGPGATEITRFLGRPGDGGDAVPLYGQVRWYAFSTGDLKLPSGRDSLALDAFSMANTVGPDGKLVVVLPPSIGDHLKGIRNSGTYVQHTTWSDSYVEFRQPPGPGVAVIWRDFLPSRPIADVRDLARQLLQAHVTINLAAEGYYPIRLGEPFRLGVEQLLDKANSLLADLLDKDEVQVRFAFRALPYAGSDFSADNDLKVVSGPKECISGAVSPDDVPPDGYVDPPNQGAIGVSGLSLELRARPRITAKDPETIPLKACGAFTVQLSVMISGTFLGVPLGTPQRPFITIDIGLPLLFRPEPIVLPTMAVFFQHPNYTGAPLVLLPKGMYGMPPDWDNKYDDDTTQSSWDETKAQVHSKLGAVHDLLKMLVFFDLMDHVPNIDVILDVIGRIQSATRLVFSSQGGIDDLGTAVFDSYNLSLGQEGSFGRKISSVIMVGVPYEWSGIAVNCYAEIKCKGEVLQLALPNDTYVAGVPYLAQPEQKGQLMGMEVELPYAREANQPGGPPDNQGRMFDDWIASIKIVTP